MLVTRGFVRHDQFYDQERRALRPAKILLYRGFLVFRDLQRACGLTLMASPQADSGLLDRRELGVGLETTFGDVDTFVFFLF